MNALHHCLRTSVICVTVAANISAVHAQRRTRVDWSVRPDLAATPGSDNQSFFLESRTSIAFELRVYNDEESSRTVLLKEGFIRNVEVSLRDGDDRIVATNAGWQSQGYCPNVPKCASGSTVRLRPGQGAAFFGTFATRSLPNLQATDYYVHITMTPTAAQRFVTTDDGTLWEGLIERPQLLALIMPRTADDRRIVDYTRALQAQVKRHDAEALRLYRKMLAAAPNDSAAMIGAGETLLRLHRFAEGVETLERAVAIVGIDINRAREGLTNRAAAVLVIGYYALGQDAKAENLLRQMHQPEEIAQAIKNSQEAAARIKAAR